MALIRNRQIVSFPVVAIGGEFWQSLRAFLLGTLAPEGTIDAQELETLMLTDDVSEAVNIIRRAAPCPRKGGGLAEGTI